MRPVQTAADLVGILRAPFALSLSRSDVARLAAMTAGSDLPSPIDGHGADR